MQHPDEGRSPDIDCEQIEEQGRRDESRRERYTTPLRAARAHRHGGEACGDKERSDRKEEDVCSSRAGKVDRVDRQSDERIEVLAQMQDRGQAVEGRCVAEELPGLDDVQDVPVETDGSPSPDGGKPQAALPARWREKRKQNEEDEAVERGEFRSDGKRRRQPGETDVSPILAEEEDRRRDEE